MSGDALFGGTPLVSDHFETELAKSVFNDRGAKSRLLPVQQAMEKRILNWIGQASPKQIMRFSLQIDLIVVPLMSPSGFRRFCGILCETLPQAIENMPNTRASVNALAKAVHLSRFINPAALNRIHDALASEGLTKN